METTKCFACGRKIKGRVMFADTRDDQIVYVGPDCYKKILKERQEGYQPPKGGPKLFPKEER